MAQVLEQHKLERGLGDGEVAGLDFGQRGAEQLGVERDRLVGVIDVKSELHARHDHSPSV